MLMELSIRNFAIIDTMTVSFDEGLTVLTGETGAGKSIIIDAIGLLIGGRGSVEFVRHGSKRAEIEGLFSVDRHHDVYKLFNDVGIETGEEETILLKREITKQGKSICRVNGKLVTLAVLRQIGQMIVDIHGQHEHQQLLQEDKHLTLLDRFAEDHIKKPKHEYKELYQSFIKKRKELKQLSENEQEMAQRLDLIKYQYHEITEANIQPEEDTRLTEEKKRLSNSEELFKTTHGAYEALYGDNRGLEWVMVAMNQIEEAAEMDEQLHKLKETITNCYYLLEEATYSLRDYHENIEFDPDRLNEIELRLNELTQLKRKYGETVNEVLEYASKIEDEMDTLNNRDERLQQWESDLAGIAKDLIVEGKHLTEVRKYEAKRLEENIQTELEDLYMKNTKFQVEFHEHSFQEEDLLSLSKSLPITKEGIDDISFMVATNKGEPLKPLAKVASGGEISRMILALKKILATHEGVTSLIFDEVDTGVSGRVAQAIAEKIHHISVGSQVLCITHLPQVAAMADTHLFISKGEDSERVTTSVKPLNEEEQIEELSRMISGVEITELTKEHAKELLEQANQIKQSLG
ncbi:DNA repair protein RecN [Bacillus shivajii]|uniref:DNA repair protein RecN n=1 Tax=Bacillus shivajii TaxID=1983719 RepID=UPI001CFAF036|nr:DNA repair protein RecN [Bacillus shivajii]UCZ54616.1 DNA repair protein RecN [Bacillus shivajii]